MSSIHKVTDAALGRVSGVNGSLIDVEIEQGTVALNEVAYIHLGERRLKSEVIRIRGSHAELQVFEVTRGLGVGDRVSFVRDLLTARLGPGLLGKVYDGLQNPLPELAERCGFFLERGIYLDALSSATRWKFTPLATAGDRLQAGDHIGTVREGIFDHTIMVPFDMSESYSLRSVVSAGEYRIDDEIAQLENERGATVPITMSFDWPVKRPIVCYSERLKPIDPMITKVRIIDTFLPVARGGTYCIPGPFGAGKTVLQQITSRNADVDIVIIAACGERAGEVVETLQEFPELIDPRTGRSLMERTVIVVNTSSMPVAAREASVYTAVTIAEYYRQMGLHVLLLADSTSRWAQAMREMSGRLEEIPGEEAFPAYLESVVAAFYERAGLVRLRNGSVGSVTIGGTVSPAGGNFEEPVTQATLKVVGAFHGLSRERSDARKYPSIHPLESWSKYNGIVDQSKVEYARAMLTRGDEVGQMMKVVGEEGVGLGDYIVHLKADFLDAVYLQQNAFDEVDAAIGPGRQEHVFKLLYSILVAEMEIEDKGQALDFFHRLRQRFLDYNGAVWESPEFIRLEEEIRAMVVDATSSAQKGAAQSDSHSSSPSAEQGDA